MNLGNLRIFCELDPGPWLSQHLFIIAGCRCIYLFWQFANIDCLIIYSYFCVKSVKIVTRQLVLIVVFFSVKM